MRARLYVAILAAWYSGSAFAEHTHICWIDRVVVEGKGVRVFYNRSGGPLSGRTPEGVYAVEGDHLSPSNSPHDACDIEVQRRGDKLGVLAQASFFVHGGIMNKPQTSEEWVEAVPADSDR